MIGAALNCKRCDEEIEGAKRMSGRAPDGA
jgi:hypothetical protein